MKCKEMGHLPPSLEVVRDIKAHGKPLSLQENGLCRCCRKRDWPKIVGLLFEKKKGLASSEKKERSEVLCER